MRYELKSIRIWSFTKVSFFVNLVVGFVLGLMYAMMLPILMAGMSELGGFYGQNLDPSEVPIGVMLVIMPIMGAMFAAVFHTLIGIVLVAVYNLVVRLVGGLEMRFEPVETKPVSQVARPITSHMAPHNAPLTMQPLDDTARVAATPPPPPPVPGVSPISSPPNILPTPTPKTVEPTSPQPAAPSESENRSIPSTAPAPPKEIVLPPRPTTEPGQSTDDSAGEGRPSTADDNREL